MQLDEIDFQIGTSLQLQLLADKTKRYTVKLIGFHQGHGLIISTPNCSESELDKIFKDGESLNLRIRSNKQAAALQCTIVGKSLKPYPHIYLSTPDEIENIEDETLQQDDIIELDQSITFINDDEDCRATQSILSGISLFEACIRHHERLVDKGQRATVTMGFAFADKNNVIVLEGIISSVSADPDSGEQTMTLSYEELDESDRILLNAYIYERILVNMKIIDDPAG